MSEAERKQFEKELETNTSLQEEYKNYLVNIKKLKKFNSVELNEKYFINAVPVMHSRLEKKRHFSIVSPKFGLALSSASAAVLVFLMFIGRTSDNLLNLDKNPVNTVKIEKSVKELSAEEMSNVYDAYSGYESSIDNTIKEAGVEEDSEIISRVNDKLAAEIVPNDEQLAAIESTETYEYLTGSINDKEADVVCNEIMNKEFFKGK
jgi:hypothetical protein